MNPLSHLTQLTGLELLRTDIPGISAELQPLSALSGLRLLRLPNTRSRALWITRLRHLTQLEINPCTVNHSTPAAFSGMQQLQQLVFTDAAVFDPQLLAGLPASLTRLDLEWENDQPLSASTVPALTCLTAMQHLDLTSKRGSSGITPDFLRRMRRLRVLKLGGLHRDALVTLLDNMPSLTQLEELQLARYMRNVQPLLEEQRAHYAALLPPSPVLRRVAMLGLQSFRMLPDG
jgi:hypothetical protein